MLWLFCLSGKCRGPPTSTHTSSAYFISPVAVFLPQAISPWLGPHLSYPTSPQLFSPTVSLPGLRLPPGHPHRQSTPSSVHLLFLKLPCCSVKKGTSRRFASSLLQCGRSGEGMGAVVCRKLLILLYEGKCLRFGILKAGRRQRPDPHQAGYSGMKVV